MNEFIVIDTKTDKVILQPTTCHNAHVYADFMNENNGNRYKAVNKNNINFMMK